MQNIVFIILLSFSYFSYAQEITGSELLDRTIAYHDPNGNWPSFAGKLIFVPEQRDGKTINRIVEIDNKRSYFRYFKDDGENRIDQSIEGDSCSIVLNGSSEISAENREEFRLNCETTQRIRNYYVYLYGLPMKLTDEGTIVDKAVTNEQFMGENYLKLKVTYDSGVGKDIWYFYINPETFAMEAYQFYHDEEKGDGEYITLDGILETQGMKIPQLRKWYTNKEDKFLGTDDLSELGQLR